MRLKLDFAAFNLNKMWLRPQRTGLDLLPHTLDGKNPSQLGLTSFFDPLYSATEPFDWEQRPEAVLYHLFCHTALYIVVCGMLCVACYVWRAMCGMLYAACCGWHAAYHAVCGMSSGVLPGACFRTGCTNL